MDANLGFDDVFASERLGLVRIAFLIVGSRSVAEELAQDAFIRLHARFDDVENPAGFLRTALVRLCLNWKRRAEVEARYRATVAEPEPTGTPDIDETWE